MHGVVFNKLKQYVTEGFNAEIWSSIVTEAGLDGTVFVPTKIYPDEHLGALVGAAVTLSGIDRETLLEDFGAFLAPHLLAMYGSMIPGEWRTEELLLNTEDTIHKVVRMKNPGAEPPRLEFERLEPGVLQLTYRSERRMSSLARGIMRGIATGYGEQLRISEETLPEGGQRMWIYIAPLSLPVAG